HRYFPGRDELGEQYVSFADFGLELRELPEEGHARLLSPFLDQGRHPLGIGRFDADAPLPFRVGEAEIALGKFLPANQTGVVAHHEYREAVGHPQAVFWNAVARQIRRMRRVVRREHLLAYQRLQLRAVGRDYVRRIPVRFGLAQGALENALRERTPKLDLD